MTAVSPTRPSRGNLAAEFTSFVGRRAERAEIRRLMETSRLVTLTGFGGIGKTRLAVRVAADLNRTFRHGAWVAELAGLTDPSLVPHAVADALELRDPRANTGLPGLADYLADRELLLVLDNCEHLLDACAAVVEELLRRCPALRVLTTSRQPLGMTGEVVLEVQPLSLPVVHDQGVSGLAESEALALFSDRVSAVLPEFSVTDENRLVAAQVCHMLEGIPLAIELTAVWVRALSLEQILRLLDDRCGLLTRGSRTAHDRHRTLQACVAWSYDLCSPEEQRLWADLSVFVGAFELDAVEGVCLDPDDPGARHALLSVLMALVDKSILRREQRGDRTQYRMLETVRNFGEQIARDSERWSTLRLRHRDWYADLVASSRAEWLGPAQAEWLDRLWVAAPNIQVALNSCLSTPDAAGRGLQMATDTRALWNARGSYGEGLSWLTRLLRRASGKDGTRARALQVAHWLAVVQGESDIAAGFRRELAKLVPVVGRPAEASAAAAAGLEAMFAKELAAAVSHLSAAVEKFGAENDLASHVESLLLLQLAYDLAGEPAASLACHRTCLEITEPLGERSVRSYSLWIAAMTTWQRGDARQATVLLRSSLELKAALDDRTGIALCLEVLAWIAAGRATQRAAVLLGAAASQLEAIGASISRFPALLDHHVATEAALRNSLDEDVYRAADERGHAFTLDAAVAYALDEQRAADAGRPADERPGHSPLTRREYEVACLLVRGLTNRDIARELVISPRTADTHVEHILGKLGFSSRTQIAAWVTERQLEAE